MKNTFERTRLQFLPAALEVQHSPPHPLARWLGIGIILFFSLAIAWGVFGKVDVVAMAEGKIIPSARIKEIQPLEKGIVKESLVREGQFVKAGDALIVLDGTSSSAARDRLANELQAMQDMLLLEQSFLARLENTAEVTRSAMPELQEKLLEQQWQQYNARLAALRSQREHRIAEKQANSETIIKWQNTLPMISQRVNGLKQLAGKKLVAENQYLELEEIRITQQQELAAARARDAQLVAAIAECEQQIAALTAQTHAETLARIADAGRQRNSLHQQLKQAKDLDDRQVLYAPVSGQVQDLTIHTVGGVVLEAQLLMRIVPGDSPLEVEAWLPNQDIGFVQENDRAIIKVHTFPFTRYGTINATVTRISDDAVADNKDKNRLFFGMSLLLEKNTLPVDGREVRLAPGMQVTVEIMTGERRLVEYFLSPLQKHLQESGRER
ncbi:MAG: HlyD family type I secretion periplasmic adaptor subunit [Cellvibrionales bacterium]|nr:HlyD family type I secretion periplasmic adaptor subunit [Cellvibrionales bacterium]